MTTGLDPKRRKNASLGGSPPADGFITNKFDGTGNPDQGEKYDYDPVSVSNKSLSHDQGHDTAGPFAGGDFAG